MISVQEDLFQEELGGLHSTEVAFALLTKIFLLLSLWTEERSNISCAFARDFANAVSSEYLS